MRPVPIVLLGLVLAGCTSYPAGVKDSECRYGQSGDQPDEQGAHCLTRPAPGTGVTAQAASGKPLARALAAYARAHPGARVNSVGINQWGETTFATGDALVTYGPGGRTTSGQADYVFAKGVGTFPLGSVRPAGLRHVVAAVEGAQPGTGFVRARFAVDPFTSQDELEVEMRFPRATDITYAAAADGSGLCHGQNFLPSKPIRFSPAIPPCQGNPLPITFTDS